MRVAFVHYHLNPGGVTSVIRHQAEVLSGLAETLVVTGESPATDFPAPTAVVPGLAYDTRRDPQRTAEEVAEQVLAAVTRRWPSGCDVLHVHNPTLAKNRLFPEVLARLQHRGVRLLLQIHDFAEDARPGAYSTSPYPADCHYAVLNRRDRRMLQTAGLHPDGIHLLPNRVRAPAPADPSRPPENHVLYPVRAIRRKNIGEAVLVSLCLPRGVHLAVTLGPNSPPDFGPYRFWRAFVARHRLAVEWEAARRSEFSDLVQTARFLTTTSIAEGFGFAFLEPWAAGKLLWGRWLPAVCEDFSQNGVQLDHLYTAIHVPVAWLDRRRWRIRWHQALAAAEAAFGRTPDPGAAQEAFERLAAADLIDFGMLDEPLQAGVIRRCLKHPTDRKRLMTLNPSLSAPGQVAAAEALISTNAAAVARHYSSAADRRRLMAAYEAARLPVRHAIDKTRLLDRFLDLKHFSLLRWGQWKL